MGDITMEKKLELIQQVRSQYSKNQYDMSNRERILYGKGPAVGEYQTDAVEKASPPVSFFKLRFLLAMALLAAVIVFDKSGMKIAGTTMETFFQAISADYYGEVTEFVEAVTEVTE